MILDNLYMRQQQPVHRIIKPPTIVPPIGLPPQVPIGPPPPILVPKLVPPVPKPPVIKPPVIKLGALVPSLPPPVVPVVPVFPVVPVVLPPIVPPIPKITLTVKPLVQRQRQARQAHEKPLPPISTHPWDISGKYTDIDGNEWYLPNHNQFLRWITEHFQEYSLSTVPTDQDCETYSQEESPDPFPYQKFIHDYLVRQSPYRGLLAYHHMGSGKTRTAVELFLTYMQEGIRTIFMSNASVQDNFKREAYRWGFLRGMSDTAINAWLIGQFGQKSLMITMNASNTIKTLETLIEIEGLDNKLIIIDEVHN